MAPKFTNGSHEHDDAVFGVFVIHRLVLAYVLNMKTLLHPFQRYSSPRIKNRSDLELLGSLKVISSVTALFGTKYKYTYHRYKYK